MIFMILTSFSGISLSSLPSLFFFSKHVILIKSLKTFCLDMLAKQKQSISETSVGFLSAFSLFSEQVFMPKLYILQ